MFDSYTADLIRSAPSLEGLDADALPKNLTSAYAEIVAARIRLRGLIEGTEPSRVRNHLESTIGQMRRLASTQEALVVIGAEPETRAASAFVAGAAHHVVLQAQRLLESETPFTRLDANSVSPEVSATLLFLVAEASADAAEMARGFTISSGAPEVERVLLESISSLAHGRLIQILSKREPDLVVRDDAQLGERAVSTLYFLLFQGVRALALQLSGQENDEAVERFKRVQELAVRRIGGLGGSENSLAFSIFSGPSHLATLLLAVARDLPRHAVALLPAPKYVEASSWEEVMREVATHRPYLWRNHLAAISEGYLKEGASAAVSFPTGAGKSTVADLKVAATLVLGRKVVSLAPTLALVDQTARAFHERFPRASLAHERAERNLFDLEEEELPNITVMTPERCLALMGFEPDRFSDVGLLVFDECHLLHPREGTNDRRSIDAMLCLLNFTAIAKNADILMMSAMMSNTKEIAEWVASLTGRNCVSLAMGWKPTRQVRGCVVYDARDVGRLRQLLRTEHRRSKTKGPGKETKEKVVAKPFGFFCLNQTWQSRSRDDYALLGLLDEPVGVGISSSGHDWYLTPNGNQVAAAIATSAAGIPAASEGLRTLVFTQTIPWADSTAKRISRSLGRAGCQLSREEQRLYNVCREEMGGENPLYVQVSKRGRLRTSSLPHHGLLLPAERQLHESLFRRKDGVKVLVATSTLTQGMNLPGDLVIIASDTRFDSTADRMQRLEAHELLNAAGRAGRAGERAYGLVLIIPSKLISLSNTDNAISRHWSELRAVFSQSDQCLAIEDPLEPILDRIGQAGVEDDLTARYLLRRLPVELEARDVDAAARALLRRSMCAYFKKKEGQNRWVERRIGAVLRARREGTSGSSGFDWADALAASLGVESRVIRSLEARLERLARPWQVEPWCDWVMEWLDSDPQFLPALLRPESVERLFGKIYKSLPTPAARSRLAGHAVGKLLRSWMAGASLAELESMIALIAGKKANVKCKQARLFVVRLVPEIAYIFSLPEQVARARRAAKSEVSAPALGLLGACVKEGFDLLEKLVLRQLLGGRISRIQVHREWQRIAHLVPSASEGEAWQDVVSRVRLGRIRSDAEI